MSDNQLESFLVSLGFKVDGSSERRFNESLTKATLQAKLLGDALEATARKVADSISSMARGFEDLFYESQRTRTSAADLKAFAFAMSQTGSSAEDANSAVEGFARALRENRGNFGFLTSAGIAVKDAAGNFRGALPLLKDYMSYLDKFPVDTAETFLNNFHVPESVFLAYRQHRAEVERWMAVDKEKNALFGIDPDKVAAESQKLMNVLRNVGGTLAKIGESFESKFFPEFTKQLQGFNEFLLANGENISQTMTSVAKAVVAVADAFAHVLADKAVQQQIDDFAKHIRDAKIEDVIKGWLAPLKEVVDDIKFVNSLFDGVLGLANRGHDALFGKDGGVLGTGKTEEQYFADKAERRHRALDRQIGQNKADEHDTRSWWQRTMPSWLGGKDAPASGKLSDAPGIRLQGGSKAGNWWTPERMKYAADRLEKEAGLTKMGAAGLVARWAAIEAKSGPTAYNTIGGGHGGIGQWGPKRGGVEMRNVPFEDQVSHAIGELKTTELRAATTLRNAQTAAEAAVGASQFERAEGWNGHHDAFAARTPVQSVYDKIIGAPEGSHLHQFLKRAADSATKVGAAIASQAANPSTALGAAANYARSNRGGLPMLAATPLTTMNTWHQPTSTTISPSMVVHISGAAGSGTADDFARSFARAGKHLNDSIIRNVQGAVQ